ncbi:MAG: BMP family protein [Anaerolineaceae bacterium]
MKKLVNVVLILAIALTFVGCSSSNGEAEVSETTSEETTVNTADEGAKIAVVITSTGSIDDRSFCQGAWEGVKQYGDEHGISYAYYQATGDSTTDLVNGIGIAVEGGAEIIVTPGYTWEAAIFEAQDLYPDVKFVLLDGQPRNEDYSEYRQEDNVYSIFYAEQESGFLAGYAAVKDGFTQLGFLGGMAVPAVIRYGYGYIAGADYAAQEMGLEKGSVTVNYHYLGNFDVSPENQTYAASWYSSGTEIIFACAGDVTSVVSSAASQVGDEKWVIGVDVNQGWDAENILTSATKNLVNSTYQALDLYYTGEFPGGESVVLTSAQDGVCLPTDEETWKFSTFTIADYENIFNKLKTDEGGLASNLPVDTAFASADLIPTNIVVVNVQ